MKRSLMKLTLACLIGLLLLPAIVSVKADVPEYGEEKITSPNEVINLIKSITGWIFKIVMLIAIIFIIIAAFNFLTAAGNPEKIATARQMLIYAIIGIAVALLAAGIPTLIDTFLSSGTATQ